MNKKLLGGSIAVALILVVYFAFLYPWPDSKNIEGTIGGVKKYNAGQISDKDVKLAETAYTGEQLNEFAQRIDKLEGRLAPDARNFVQLEYLKHLESAIAPLKPEQRLEPMPMQSRIDMLNAIALERSLGLPFDKQIASLELRIAPFDPSYKIAPLAPEKRLDNIASRNLPKPEVERFESLPLISRILVVEMLLQAKNAELPMEKQIARLEERLAGPDMSLQKESLKPEARLDNMVQRYASFVPEYQLAKLPPEQRIAIAFATAAERNAPLKPELKIAGLELRLPALTPEGRQAPPNVTIEQRLDNTVSRIAPPDVAQRIAPFKPEARLAAAEVYMQLRAALKGPDGMMSDMESRLMPALRTQIQLARLGDIEGRIAAKPGEARIAPDIPLQQRLDNTESRIAPVNADPRITPQN
jgi:hypothetical protein